MDSFLEGVKRAHAESAALARTAHTLSDWERAELGAAWLALLDAADAVEKVLAATRVCPGTYWRGWEPVRARMMGVAVAAPKKRRTKKTISTECKTSGRHPPTFARAELGPLREDGGERMVCDACAQKLGKDRKAHFVDAK